MEAIRLARYLRILLGSRCGLRLTLYGLALFLAGLAAGFALGYSEGWERALEAVNRAS